VRCVGVTSYKAGGEMKKKGKKLERLKLEKICIAIN
jgi:hypothetical protein